MKNMIDKITQILCYILFSICFVSCTFFKKESMDELSLNEAEPASEEYIEEKSDDTDFVDEEEEDMYEDGTEGEDENNAEETEEVDNFSSTEETPNWVEENKNDNLLQETDSISDSFSNSVNNNQAKKQKKWIPLKKIPQTSWMHNKKWINAVFIARQDDTLESISQLIFSNDQTEELKSINPFLNRRSVKVGDKIYYNSPNRSNDRNFLLYYEDINETPQTHDIQSGENIRTISTQLLGHKDSWKEIWASNMQLESKNVVLDTVTIRYWKRRPATALPESTDLTTKEEPAVTPEEESPFASDTPSEEELSPTTEEGTADIPIEGVDSNPLANNEVSSNELPLQEEVPVVPPSATNESEPSSHMDQNQSTLSVKGILSNWKFKGAIIGLILLIVGFWFIRLIRSKKSRSDFDFSQTNIDIDNIEE